MIKLAALVAALALGANFHELLAAWGGRLHISETMWLAPAYLLILVLVLWVGRLLNQALIIKLLKRETPGSSVERLLGAAVGAGRGPLAMGALLLMLQIAPLGGVADYVSASVYERSATGAKVVDGSRLVIERAANAAPGRFSRSELFPFAP